MIMNCLQKLHKLVRVIEELNECPAVVHLFGIWLGGLEHLLEDRRSLSQEPGVHAEQRISSFDNECTVRVLKISGLLHGVCV